MLNIFLNKVFFPWEIYKVRLYLPIVHGRDGLLHPGPGVQGLRLERGAVRHVAEHRHGRGW